MDYFWCEFLYLERYAHRLLCHTAKSGLLTFGILRIPMYTFKSQNIQNNQNKSISKTYRKPDVDASMSIDFDTSDPQPLIPVTIDNKKGRISPPPTRYSVLTCILPRTRFDPSGLYLLHIKPRLYF